METTIGKDLVDHAQIVEHFQASRLQTLARRSGEEFRSLFDDAETHLGSG
jgi:hypothetical protein